MVLRCELANGVVLMAAVNGWFELEVPEGRWGGEIAEAHQLRQALEYAMRWQLQDGEEKTWVAPEVPTGPFMVED